MPIYLPTYLPTYKRRSKNDRQLPSKRSYVHANINFTGPSNTAERGLFNFFCFSLALCQRRRNGNFRRVSIVGDGPLHKAQIPRVSRIDAQL